MIGTPLGNVLGRVRTLFASQGADVSDSQFLTDFVERRDEWAFAALVHRHGAMVLSVCRRLLRDAADAEDAFQATFLVLARKAGSIRKREALGGWLHAVAFQIARKLRSNRMRREGGKRPLDDVAQPDTTAEATWREVRAVLDEELAQLPDMYRAPLVLCYLEGKTQDEAARELGWSLGSLRGRLERGRERLRRRLVRRGVTLSAALAGGVLAQASASGAASTALEVAAVKSALLAHPAGVSAHVAALADGAVRAMFLGKLRAVASWLAISVVSIGTLGGVATYSGLTSFRPAAADKPADGQSTTADEKAVRELIKQLGNDDFEKREAAHKRLVEIGEPALEMLRQAARESRDAEISQRATKAAREIARALFGEVRHFEGHTSKVEGMNWVGRVTVTKDGRQAYSVGWDAVRCWDLESGKQVAVFGEADGGYWAVSVSGDGRLLIAGNNNNLARVFDVKTGRLIHDLKGHTGEVWGAVLLPDGKKAVTGSWDKSIRVWDVDTGKELRAFEGVRDMVRCIALSPDGKFIAAGHFPDHKKPGVVRLWDVETGKEVRTFAGHAEEVSSVAFSPDGKKLLSSSFDKTVRLWDVETGKELKRFGDHPARVEYAAFTPDGKRIVSGCSEHHATLHVWDVESGKQLFESEKMVDGFLGIAVLPDGKHCVTSGKDGMVRLWQWAR
jgi:RNA polymerase sigma factor (sigma-70 family)